MESLHPLVAHFPIALLLSAVRLDVAALVFRRSGLHRIALWNLWLGALGAAVAVWTGYQAAEIAKHSFDIHQVMELHRKLGSATLMLAAVVVLWRLWRRDELRRRARLVTLVLLLTMVATLSYGAHLGGRLVYEFGVGGSFGVARPAIMTPYHH